MMPIFSETLGSYDFPGGSHWRGEKNQGFKFQPNKNPYQSLLSGVPWCKTNRWGCLCYNQHIMMVVHLTQEYLSEKTSASNRFSHEMCTQCTRHPGSACLLRLGPVCSSEVYDTFREDWSHWLHLYVNQSLL